MIDESPSDQALSAPFVDPKSWRIRHPLTLAIIIAVGLTLLGLCLANGKAIPSSDAVKQHLTWNPPLSPAAAPAVGEAMQWAPVAIGGGGFITGLAWDAKGRTKVIRTDVFGAYRWDDQADRWLQLVTASSMPADMSVQEGSAEGVYEIVVAPSDARRLYIAFKGAIFRSDDRGERWRRVLGGGDRGPLFRFDPNAEFRFYGPYLAVAPDDPDLVVFGSPEQGLWRSRDGGSRWDRIGSVPQPIDLRPKRAGVQAPGIAVWFEPGAKPARLWAASAGHGIYAGTAAQGNRFSPIGGPRSVRRGAFAKSGPIRFFAVDSETKSLSQYRDGGWQDLTGRAGAKGRAVADVATSADGGVVVTDESGRLWCSANGASWSYLPRKVAVGQGDPPWLAIADNPYFATAQIAFDPDGSGRLWVAAGTGVFTADDAARCGPIIWKSRARGIEEIVANDVVSAPGLPPVFAGWDFGIHLKPDLNAFSTGYGPRQRMLIAAQQVDWTPARPGFLVTNASDTRMNCCSEDGQSVLAGYSEDGGKTWARFASLPTPPGTDASDPWRMSFGSIAVAADDPDNIVWQPAFNRSPFYTLDRGRTWRRVVLPGEILPKTGSFTDYFLQRKTVAADRVAKGTFYLMHSGDKPNVNLRGLWVTHDKGVRWQRIHPLEVVPFSGRAAKLRVVPNREGWLFATAGQSRTPDSRLRRSTDGGATWTIVPDVDGVDDIGFGKPARKSPFPTIFIAGRVRGAFGVWRSVDNAVSWQKLANFPFDRLDQVTVVEGDKNVFGRVYLGYKGSGWIFGEPALCKPQPVDQRMGRSCNAVD